ncbi:electron transport complex subunit RsxC [Candidatus Calescamantes bacterium]|nr:electron transport complex subunit RsxC [Candidatus Calescamantes bacterium]
MKRFTFVGGVHPKESKLTSSLPIEELPLPEKVIIPLQQHIGAPNQPTVKKGDEVFTGTLLGKSDAFVSSPVFSSITGKVVEIGEFPHPVLGRGKAIVIEKDEEEIIDPSLKPIDNPENTKIQVLLDTIREKGIVGMGGAAFPTHVKLSPPSSKPIDTVIINGAECEPYLTCDERLMIENGEEIIKGVKIIQRILNPERTIIAIEENKPEAISSIGKLIEKDIEIVILKTKYPQGGEKQLIKAVLKRDVPSGGLPLDIGVVVHNVGTCFAIYEAIYRGKPLYERIITVTGEVERPKNLRVRLGTPLSFLIEFCGGLKEKVNKIVFGGPMMGIAQISLEVPVIKGTSGVVALKKTRISPEYPCIRCARCVDVCPVNLLPTQLARIVKFEKWELLEEYNVMDCIECGCCAYVCPSNIPIVQYIKAGKDKLRRIKR